MIPIYPGTTHSCHGALGWPHSIRVPNKPWTSCCAWRTHACTAPRLKASRNRCAPSKGVFAPPSAQLEDFQCHRGCLAAANAQRSDTSLEPALLERVHQGGGDPSAGRADRMPECTGATIDVDASMIDTDVAHRGHGDDGECLIDLIEINLPGTPSGLLQHSLDGACGSGGKPLGRLRETRIGNDSCQWCRADRAGGRLACQHQSRGTIGDR